MFRDVKSNLNLTTFKRYKVTFDYNNKLKNIIKNTQ